MRFVALLYPNLNIWQHRLLSQEDRTVGVSILIDVLDDLIMSPRSANRSFCCEVLLSETGKCLNTDNFERKPASIEYHS